MTPLQFAQRALDQAAHSHYAAVPDPDASERAALAICVDLCDRFVTRHAMVNVDTETRSGIVSTMAAIIRISMRPAGVVGAGESVLSVDELVKGIEARLAQNIVNGVGPLAGALRYQYQSRGRE